MPFVIYLSTAETLIQSKSAATYQALRHNGCNVVEDHHIEIIMDNLAYAAVIAKTGRT